MEPNFDVSAYMRILHVCKDNSLEQKLCHTDRRYKAWSVNVFGRELEGCCGQSKYTNVIVIVLAKFFLNTCLLSANAL